MTTGVSFSCYPNPSQGTVTLTFAESGSVKTIQVFDVLGNKVQEAAARNRPTQTIELKNLPAGKYIVRVSDGKVSLSQSVILN
jgi:hypothetical protein